MDQRPLGDVCLDTIRKRITEYIPRQVRECLDQLTDDQLCWRPNEQANSVGNLILHASGSTRHFLSRYLGGVDYQRNRRAEFTERGPLPRGELLAIFEGTIAEAVEILANFDTARLLEPGAEPGYYDTVFEQLLGITVHLATHAGQIAYVTKLLNEGSLDEVWIRAHSLK